MKKLRTEIIMIIIFMLKKNKIFERTKKQQNSVKEKQKNVAKK